MKHKIAQGELFAMPTLPHGVTDLQAIDTERGRRELGDCRDENGVSFWDIVECLKRDGVRQVKFI